jgi:uncharacterized protein YjbI with pentapeptide repeats
MATKYMGISALLMLAAFITPASAAYRYQDKICQENGRAGFNEGSFSECGRVEGKSVTSLLLKKRVLRAIRMRTALLKSVNWSSVNLDYAIAQETFWYAPILRNISLLQSDFRGARIESAQIKGVEAKKSDFRAARILYSSLSEIDFHRADLRDSYFLHSNLKNIDFSGADLRGSVWLKTKCENCRYDPLTKLPWNESEAKRRGFLAHE